MWCLFLFLMMSWISGRHPKQRNRRGRRRRPRRPTAADVLGVQGRWGRGERGRSGGCGRWIDAHWEGGGGVDGAMIYSLNSPSRSPCLFADPQKWTRKALKSPLIFSSLKYERKSRTDRSSDTFFDAMQSKINTRISLKWFRVLSQQLECSEAEEETMWGKWSRSEVLVPEIRWWCKRVRC